MKKQSQWCDRHWQPYRERRANGILASLRLMYYFADDARVRLECGGGEVALADASKLNASIHDHLPLCCFLGDDVMDRIFKEASEGYKPPAGPEEGGDGE